MDTLTRSERSVNMSKIRGGDTRPELRVRSALHRRGFRFRLHRKDLPGSPDIVLPRHRIALFVHGCFWHRHEGCKFSYTPKSNRAFWLSKFRANRARDRSVVAALEVSGWRVAVIWECETKKESHLRKAAGRITALSRRRLAESLSP
ncbi:MAG: very short patch repair endonuclease [Vicinamibacterales bacterium]